MFSDWLVWIDIETTGLDPQTCKIIQISCMLSDFNVSTLLKFPEINIFCEDDFLSLMDDWCKQTHTESGLIDKVKNSDITMQAAEEKILRFIDTYTRNEHNLYIAGNSVHFDKKFIDHWMPNLSKRLNYRIVDVTSIALLCKILNKGIYDTRPEKKYLHTSEADILESIEEYRYYKTFFLNKLTLNQNIDMSW